MYPFAGLYPFFGHYGIDDNAPQYHVLTMAKWPFTVRFPVKKYDFHSYVMLVYQRVNRIMSVKLLTMVHTPDVG